MSQALPDPLVPADVDLRDFAFMPLDVQRLRDSDLAADETPEACWAAVLLWCAAWHQVPAASIPDSAAWQAKQAGYLSRGRIDPSWSRVQAGALRGWVPCSDGRLYHPVIAEKARDAWRSKLEQRWKTECARIKKSNQRHQTNVAVPDFEAWLSSRTVPSCPQGQSDAVPGDKANASSGTDLVSPREVPRETPSKGQGEGQGQGEEERQKTRAATATAVARASIGDVEPTAAGRTCRAMRTAGIADVNPGHPDLLTLLAAGATEAEFVGAATKAAEKGKGFAYAIGTLVRQRQDAAETATTLHRGAMPSAPTGSNHGSRRPVAEVLPERQEPADPEVVQAALAKLGQMRIGVGR